jgi:hypothetical protein
MKKIPGMFVLCVLTLIWAGDLRGEESAAKARHKSVTVYPVEIEHPGHDIGPMPQRMAEIIGMFLERSGMTEVKLTEDMFTAPKTDDTSKIAEDFAQFATKKSLKTEYALFVQLSAVDFKIKGIRSIVADKNGKVIFNDFTDQETYAKNKRQPTDEPLTVCLFVAERLGRVWDLADPLRSDVSESKIEKRMNNKAGIPSDDEIAAIEKRQKLLKGKISTGKITVYPIHLWGGSDKPAAAELTKMINDQKMIRTSKKYFGTLPGHSRISSAKTRPKPIMPCWPLMESGKKPMENRPSAACI